MQLLQTEKTSKVKYDIRSSKRDLNGPKRTYSTQYSNMNQHRKMDQDHQMDLNPKIGFEFTQCRVVVYY